MDQDNPTTREDIGYTGATERPRIKPAMIRVVHLRGVDSGAVRWIRADIAEEMIRDGIAREAEQREPGMEG